IIIKVQEKEEKYLDVPILALPRYYCSSNRTYVILGGLGDFGLEVVDWLVTQEAKNLNHTIETFQEPFKKKAWATKNLEQLSIKIYSQLRHFVIFSSVSCRRGNAEQSNYGTAYHGKNLLEEITGRLERLNNSVGRNWRCRYCCRYKLSVVASKVVAEKRLDISTISIVDTVAKIMGLKDMKIVSSYTCLSELGMDLMMAMEIKQTLEREYDVFFTSQDIRNLFCETVC
ncbi:PREDICTED: fatty acid synthase-like, partial [Dinoponera quadriceps]|uniref:Fatty acid synthase-like n=1 Tax=Dinoponera quadriceps TaxID=609295 RepID=A0A6P3X530_DINQU